jgi:hypothetical protein
MSKFYKLSQETIDIFKDIFSKKSFSVTPSFEFLGNESQKTLIKISKISDQHSFLSNKEVMVQINEDLMSIFDDDSVGILIEQELDKLSVNIDNGKIKIIKPDLVTSYRLIKKYGVEKVSKANKVETLYADQKEDDPLNFNQKK